MRGTRGLGATLALVLLTAAPAAAEWQPPERIDNTGSQFLEFVDGDIGTGANGLTSAFFWQRTETSGDSGQLFGARRTEDGAWQEPAPAPSLSTATPTFTDAVSAPDGDALAAFTFDRTLRTIGWPAADAAPGSIFDTGVIAEGDNSGAVNTPNPPRIAVDGAGNAYALSVRRENGYRAVVFTYDAASGSWSDTPLVATPTDGDVYNPKIAANENGDLAVSWAANRTNGPARIAVARKRKDDAAFSALLAHQRYVSEQEGGLFPEDVEQHDVAIDGEGNITVAYAQDSARSSPSQGEPQTYDRIHAVRWPAGSSTPDLATRTLVSSPDPQAGSTYDPQLAVSGQGRIFLAWRQLDNPIASPDQADDQLFVAEYTGEWGAPIQVTDADAPSYDIAVDGAGFLTVAWAEDGMAKARRKPPGEDFEDEAVISLTGDAAGEVSMDFAPRVSDSHGTQTDVLFKQELAATEREQALAARFGFPPDAPPGPEPDPAPPPLSNCPAGNEQQVGDDADNTLTGTPGNDTLLGLAGNDALFGLDGVDCLRGGDGNDRVAGGPGGDDVQGGAGNDIVEGNEGNDALAGDEGDDLLAGHEGIDLIFAGPGNDGALGGDENDFILGGAGDDRLFGQAGRDFISGDEGDDHIRGQDGNDLLAGGDRHDSIAGGDGRDIIDGGDGDDRLGGQRGADRLLGDDGDDQMRGGKGGDELVGGPGANTLFGDRGPDLLLGDTLDDVIRGGRGRDHIVGREGADQIAGQHGHDRIAAGDGDDRVFGNRGRDRIRGGDGNDRIFGGKGWDRIGGGAGDDRVRGGRGRDRINAGAGDDRIDVRDGRRDVVICGRGSDLVIADRRDRLHRSCEFVRVGRARASAG